MTDLHACAEEHIQFAVFRALTAVSRCVGNSSKSAVFDALRASRAADRPLDETLVISFATQPYAMQKP